jgi:hypothetical protein
MFFNEFLSSHIVIKSQGSSVGVATGYKLDDLVSGALFPAGAGNFSLQHRV